jgi:heme-degrading monooxygenase HmoA
VKKLNAEEAGNEMIERHVTFHVLPGKEDEFARFFVEEYRPAMERTVGFIQASLLKDTEQEQDLMLTLRFDSLDAAAAWRASSLHRELKPHLKSLYNGSELKVHEVVVRE